MHDNISHSVKWNFLKGGSEFLGATRYLAFVVVSRVLSRRVRRRVYFMQLATPVFHATWISRVSHAAAFSLRHRHRRSADYQIAPDKRVPPRRVYTYIRGTFVLSRNGIIVHIIGTRYFDYAECALSRPPIHACNSSLIATAKLHTMRSQKKLVFYARDRKFIVGSDAVICENKLYSY